MTSCGFGLSTTTSASGLFSDPRELMTETRGGLIECHCAWLPAWHGGGGQGSSISGAHALLQDIFEGLCSRDFSPVIQRTSLCAGCECSFFTDADTGDQSIIGTSSVSASQLRMSQTLRLGCSLPLPPLIHQKS